MTPPETTPAADPLAEDEDDSPGLVDRRPVESATLAIVLAFAVLMGWDNWRTGVR